MTTTSFADLKKNRAAQFEALKQKLTKESEGSGDNSNEYWKPTVDKAGNGYAIIRFLPAPAGETEPFIKYWDHGFKGPTGKWYIEKSRTTLGMGEKDPVGEMNRSLWESGIQSNKDIVSGTPDRPGTKRRLHYVANIYVEQDSGNPENNGKVFKYVFGKKIFDMVEEKLYPQFDDEQSINPFDLWEGCSLKLKIRNKDGYRSYDKSEFANPAPLFDNDEKMEEVWKKAYSLRAEIAPDKFKSYDELKRKLEEVMSTEAVVPARRPLPQEEDAPRTKTAAPKEAPKEPAPWEETEEDESNPMSFFANLGK